MTSILIAILMALVGYIAFTLREYVNKYSVILLIFLMFVLDGIIVQSYYMLVNLQKMRLKDKKDPSKAMNF